MTRDATGYWKLKAKAVNSTLRGTRLGRRYGYVVKYYRVNELIKILNCLRSMKLRSLIAHFIYAQWCSVCGLYVANHIYIIEVSRWSIQIWGSVMCLALRLSLVRSAIATSFQNEYEVFMICTWTCYRCGTGRPCTLNVLSAFAFTVSKYSVLGDDATKLATGMTTGFLISYGLCFRLRASNSVPKTQTYKSEVRGSVPFPSSGKMVSKCPLSCDP
jgi:hypothetical protein